jgi:O-antigen/teichoic acid export membrane protein
VAPYLTDAGRLAFRALLALSAATVVAHACAVGVLLVLARALAPAQFGVLSFALTAQGYLVLLGGLACGPVVIREMVQRPDDLDALVGAFVGVTATSGLLACGMALVVISLAPMSADERWLLSFVAIGSLPGAMLPQPLFDAHHRQARGAIVTALSELLALAAIAWLWWLRALSLPAVGTVYATKWALASGGQWITYHLTVRRVRWRWSPDDIAVIVRSSWPVLFGGILFFVPLSAGVLLVRFRAGPSEAALIGIAYQVANAYQILGALVAQIVQPHIYGAYGLHRGFLAKLGLFAALFLSTAGLLAFAGGWVAVRLLLPPFYRAATGAMPWLIGAAALLTVGRLLSAYLLRFGQERFFLGAQLASAVLYVGACLVLAGPWIRPGAAVLAPGAVLVGVVACAWRVRSRLDKARLP